jgi:hypothetical protein
LYPSTFLEKLQAMAQQLVTLKQADFREIAVPNLEMNRDATELAETLDSPFRDSRLQRRGLLAAAFARTPPCESI